MSIKLLHRLDYMSIEPRFYIKGKDRLLTSFGGIMTILVFLSILVLSGYFIISHFEKSEVNVISYKEYKDFNREINLYYYMYKLYDIDFNPILES